MSEKRTRKEWIKNIAIVFLAIMLVLTFFSNTIMNYSLPEVAVKYVESGSITAKIRGTGTVESGDPYYVTIPQQRNVEAVMVHVGDIVEKGQVLAVLETKESTEAEAAHKALEAAKKAFEDYLLTGAVNSSIMNNAGNVQSVDTYKKQITSLQSQIDNKEKEIDDLEDDLAEVKHQIEALTVQISVTDSESVGSKEEQEAYDKAKEALETAKNALDAANAKVNEITSKLDGGIVSGNDAVSSGDAENPNTNYTALLDKYKKDLVNKQIAYDAAKLAHDKALEKLESIETSTETNLTNQLNDQKVNEFHINSKIAEKQKELDALNEQFTELTKNIGDARTLASLQDAVNEAQAAYDKLKSDEISSEVVAPFAGTIVTVPISSGNPTTSTPENGTGYTIATMQKDGKGYTMSFSVTNEQARKISVGDPCTLVNSWRYDDMTITVSAVKNDTASQGKNKLIVCDVEGEYVTPGASVSVSVGEKSANYDLIVPNSSIREDNNGKFILIVESKSTPLGNRYTATRVDVEVLAADDTQSAISAALYGWEYVITTATAPVEAGQQVRLANN